MIAHRGIHNGIPEIELGCDFVEIDLRTTKDGAIVSIHNTTIDAYVDGQSGKVKEMTLAELKSLDIGTRVDNRWKNTRIPTSYHKTIMEVKRNCPECLVMPDPGAEQNIEKVVAAYQPKIIATDMDHLSRSFVDKSHAYGIMVFTDDDEDDPSQWVQEWEEMITLGTDAIQTDQPQELIKYLQTKQ